jgi:hypothetical protein
MGDEVSVKTPGHEATQNNPALLVIGKRVSHCQSPISEAADLAPTKLSAEVFFSLKKASAKCDWRMNRRTQICFSGSGSTGAL